MTSRNFKSATMLRKNYIPKISICTGVVNKGDAVSETVIADIDALDRISRKHRINIDVRVFCGASDVLDNRVQVLDNWHDVLKQAHFQRSDLYVYHFGIYHPIHDTVLFARRDAKVMFFFHNVTPPQYCSSDAEDLLHKSYQQIELFRSADHLLVASRFSAEQLKKYLPGKTIEVAPLFGPNGQEGPLPVREPWEASRPIRLLHCGRFVPSKGANTFLEALCQFRRPADTLVEVTLAGMMEFSDRAYFEELKRIANFAPQGVSIKFVTDLPSSEIRKAFIDADALLLPSLHEGFGMPVVEAFSAGASVICSTAGALPEVADGLALTCPPADPEALAKCLRDYIAAFCRGAILCDSGELPVSVWHERIAEYSATFRRSAYLDRSVLRYSKLLESISNTSETYQKRVQDANSTALGNVDIADRNDATVMGAIIALRAKRLITHDRERGLRALLQWLFPHEQTENDIAYWDGRFRDLGLEGLIKFLAAAPEVRTSPARRQAGIYILGLLGNVSVEHSELEPTHADAVGQSEVDMDLALLATSKVPVAEFVREAYRRVLCREADPVGFHEYFNGIVSGKMTRVETLQSLAASPEAMELQKKKKTAARMI